MGSYFLDFTGLKTDERHPDPTVGGPLLADPSPFSSQLTGRCSWRALLNMSSDGKLQIGSQMLFTVGPNQHVNGTIMYIGPLHEDASGQEWVGVELAEPVGRHSGRQYFQCQPKHGLFVKAATALAATACSDVRFTKPRIGPLFTEYLAGMEAAAAEAGVKLCTVPSARLGAEDAVLGIDLQYDFLPGGAFGVPEGDDTLKPFANLLSAGAAAGATMIVSRDYHPHDHASFNTQGGPFPPHCLQGSRGSRLAASIAKSMTAAKKAHPDTVDVVFKGWHRHVDSFGAFPYPEQMAQGRLVHRQPQPHCSYLSWTGAATLCCSALDEDINAPPDVLAAEERTPLAERLGKRRNVYICGLALDFCVVDSALTAKAAGFENVWIILDVSRPSHVPPIGFLTPPAQLFAKIRDGGVQVCALDAMYPGESVGEMR